MITENELAALIVNKAYDVHSSLAPGLLESVYQRVLSYELRLEKLDIQTEVPIPIVWKGHTLDEGFRA